MFDLHSNNYNESLDCDKWRKMLKSRCDIDLFRQCPIPYSLNHYNINIFYL